MVLSISDQPLLYCCGFSLDYEIKAELYDTIAGHFLINFDWNRTIVCLDMLS